MKTPSGTAKFVILPILALLSVLALLALAAGSATAKDRLFKLKLDKASELKPGHEGYDQFKEVLDRNEGLYCMKHKEKDHSDGTLGKESPLDNGGCKTMSVTSVDDAQRDLVLICGGIHVTHQAAFYTQEQLDTVKNEFK